MDFTDFIHRGAGNKIDDFGPMQNSREGQKARCSVMSALATIKWG